MSITIHLQNPVSAVARRLRAEAVGTFGVVTFKDAKGNDVALFCAPHVAKALAEAFNAAMKSEVAA